MKHDLPFKVGHLVEAKSFVPGYRSSWFRCKVREIGWKKGQIGCTLEYIDFPDERMKWTKLYQVPPIAKGRKKNVQRDLIVRPSYPPIRQQDQTGNSGKCSEVAVVVSTNWKVGDLVDWWADNVHWCGELIQLLDPGKAKIKLPDPPIGEGLIDVVELKDLRPSLLWSPEQGWSVPLNQVDDNHCCARLIQLSNQGEQTTLHEDKDTDVSTSKFSASCTSPALSSPLHTEEHHPADPLQNQKLDKHYSLEACHGEHDPDTFKGENIEEMKDEVPLKRMKINGEGNGYANISDTDTIKASIMELEELACKVKWLKMLLNHGNAMLNTRPSWKFEENLVTDTPKPDSTTGTIETQVQGACQKN